MRCPKNKPTSLLLKIRLWPQLLLVIGWFLLAAPSPAFCTHSVTYNTNPVTRIQNWQNLMVATNRISEWDKVVLVNDYFNQFPNKSDVSVWQRQEYWATPIELITANAGDCEDVAIAKFFTLMQMGVPKERLFLIYSKFYNTKKKSIEGHIVLSYQREIGSEPFILDNINKTIGTISDFGNLIPMFAFNQDEVWSANGFVPSENIGSNVNLLGNWTDLKLRMAIHN